MLGIKKLQDLTGLVITAVLEHSDGGIILTVMCIETKQECDVTFQGDRNEGVSIFVEVSEEVTTVHKSRKYLGFS